MTAVSRLNFPSFHHFLCSLFTKEHNGNVVSAYRGTSPGPSLDRQTPALGLPFCRKVVVAGGGHGCIVSSIPEPRQGHSLPKTGPLPAYFCVKRPWLFFVTSVEWTVTAELLHLCTLFWRRRTQNSTGVGGRKTLLASADATLCAAAAAIT